MVITQILEHCDLIVWILPPPLNIKQNMVHPLAAGLFLLIPKSRKVTKERLLRRVRWAIAKSTNPLAANVCYHSFVRRAFDDELYPLSIVG